MPGWLRHFSTRPRLSGWFSGKEPRIAKRPGKSRTALKAISVGLGSQPGGWITAAFDPALVHQTHGLLGGEGGDLAMGHVARQAAAPEMDLSIHDAHHASTSLSRATARSGLDNSNPRWRCPPLTLPGHPR